MCLKNWSMRYKSRANGQGKNRRELEILKVALFNSKWYSYLRYMTRFLTCDSQVLAIM